MPQSYETGMGLLTVCESGNFYILLCYKWIGKSDIS